MDLSNAKYNWNFIYYAILGASLLLSALAFLSSGSLTHALIYFFISFLGAACLGISFLSFVVVPFYAKQHERVIAAQVAAQRAARIAAIERVEKEKAERFRSTMSHNGSQNDVDGLHETFEEAVGPKVEDARANSKPVEPSNVEDQATSLRRLMAAAQE